MEVCVPVWLSGRSAGEKWEHKSMFWLPHGQYNNRSAETSKHNQELSSGLWVSKICWARSQGKGGEVFAVLRAHQEMLKEQTEISFCWNWDLYSNLHVQFHYMWHNTAAMFSPLSWVNFGCEEVDGVWISNAHPVCTTLQIFLCHVLGVGVVPRNIKAKSHCKWMLKTLYTTYANVALL